MSFKYISPKELKVLKKRRMDLMKESETALKNEDYLLLMQHFKEIIEISDKIDDESIKTEFTEKLEFLKARITQTSTTTGVVANPEQIQEFISDLLLAPQLILREFSQPIEVAQAVPATGDTTVPVPKQPFTPAKPISLPVKGPPPPTKAPTPAVPPTKGPPTRLPTKGPPMKAPTKGPPMKAPTKGPPTRLPTKGPPMKAPTKGPPVKAPTLPSKGSIPSDKLASLPKGVPQPIKPFVSPVKEPSKPYSIPVKSSPKPLTPSPLSTSKSSVSTDDMAIEEEIKKLGSVEDQMKELKKILDEQKKKKIKT